MMQAFKFLSQLRDKSVAPSVQDLHKIRCSTKCATSHLLHLINGRCVGKFVEIDEMHGIPAEFNSWPTRMQLPATSSSTRVPSDGKMDDPLVSISQADAPAHFADLKAGDQPRPAQFRKVPVAPVPCRTLQRACPLHDPSGRACMPESCDSVAG